MSETYTLKIKNGKNKVKKKKFYFLIRKFKYNSRKNGLEFYQKKDCSKNEKTRIQKMCKRKGFSFSATPTKYSRSRNYRTIFFRKNASQSGKYRCVYCGKRIPKSKITVDHIFPIHAMETSRSTRKIAFLFGIRESNSINNLCAACRRCNLKKGTKMGGWIPKAFLGRTKWFWPVKKTIRFIVIVFILYQIYTHCQ